MGSDIKRRNQILWGRQQLGQACRWAGAHLGHLSLPAICPRPCSISGPTTNISGPTTTVNPSIVSSNAQTGEGAVQPTVGAGGPGWLSRWHGRPSCPSKGRVAHPCKCCLAGWFAHPPLSASPNLPLHGSTDTSSIKAAGSSVAAPPAMPAAMPPASFMMMPAAQGMMMMAPMGSSGMMAAGSGPLPAAGSGGMAGMPASAGSSGYMMPGMPSGDYAAAFMAAQQQQLMMQQAMLAMMQQQQQQAAGQGGPPAAPFGGAMPMAPYAMPMNGYAMPQQGSGPMAPASAPPTPPPVGYPPPADGFPAKA